MRKNTPESRWLVEIGTERLLSKSPMNSSAKAEVSSMMRTRCVNSEPVDGLVRSYKLGWYRVFYTPLQKQGRILYAPAKAGAFFICS